MHQCPCCDYKTKKINSLRIHAQKRHKITSENLYLFIHNCSRPTCKCGCGKLTKFHGITKGYSSFITGHSQRISNNWGHNKKVQEKSQETRRQMHKNGEIAVWNKGLTIDDPRVKAYSEKMNTPERAAKISKSLTGVPKSSEHKEKISKFMKEYWGKEENKEMQRQNRLKHMKKSDSWKCYGTCHNIKHNGKNIMLKSNYEMNAFKFLKDDKSIKMFTYESLYLRCENNNVYVPDFIIIYSNGHKKIIEIKSEFYLKDESNIAKFKAAQKFADENGYSFEVWTEKTHPFLQNPLT